MAQRRYRPNRLVIFVLFVGSTLVAQQPPGQQQQRAVQRQWQQLIQQIDQENASIAERQTAFYEKLRDQTKDIMQDLVGSIKNSFPGEDAPGNDWLTFAGKLGDLVGWYSKTIDDLGESVTDLGAIDAKVGELKQRLAESDVMVKEYVKTLQDIDDAIRNPDITLQPMPMPPEPDWTALDQAIENMRKEDQPALEDEDRQLQANGTAVPDILQRARQHQTDLSDAENAAKQANIDLDAQIASAQTLAQALTAQQANGIKIRIPADWVPCTCPDQHVGAGMIVNGVQYHTPLLHCQ